LSSRKSTNSDGYPPTANEWASTNDEEEFPAGAEFEGGEFGRWEREIGGIGVRKYGIDKEQGISFVIVFGRKR
jgi:hypothetical protein